MSSSSGWHVKVYRCEICNETVMEYWKDGTRRHYSLHKETVEEMRSWAQAIGHSFEEIGPEFAAYPCHILPH